MDGVVVVDKPAGISSHTAVQRMRRLAGIKRIGHLGTLDPLGTGVLPLVVGRATRLSQFFLRHDRAYEATIRCGFSTSTYDCEGEATSEPQEVELDRGRLEAALDAYRGTFPQTPPAVSAKKIDGIRAYKLVRQEKAVELEPVEVTIHELELKEVEGDRFSIRMRCGAGAYVRSVAHDVGRELGCGAHVETLRRTAMGEFNLDMAYRFEQLEELAEDGRLSEALVDAARLLPEFPACRVDEEAAGRIAHGREFHISRFSPAATAKRIKAIGPDGRLLAIGELRLPGAYHPAIVF